MMEGNSDNWNESDETDTALQGAEMESFSAEPENEFASIVTMKDVAKVKKMTKDQLKKWTNQPCTFNYVIDTTRPLNHLRNEVVGRIKVRMGEEIEGKKKRGEDVSDVDTEELGLGYLFNPANCRTFIATPALLKRNDFVPCDKNGKRI